MSSFDPELFLSTSLESSFATTYEPVPIGDYKAVVEKIDVRSPREDLHFLEVHWTIDDELMKKKLNRQVLTVRQSFRIDIDPSTNGLATGANTNVPLGRLRDILGQNAKGKPWSPRQLIGAGPALIHVEHDIQDDGRIFERVTKVVKA